MCFPFFRLRCSFTVCLALCINIIQIYIFTAGDDFKSTVHKVTFDFTGTQETQSSASSVTILDDRRTEATESFICVILRPLHLDGIVVETPNAIFFAIQDNDSMCTMSCNPNL